MGRIKTQLVKRTSFKLMQSHKDKFKEDFDENKKLVSKFISVSNNKLRNVIAGYITRLTRKKEE